MKERVDIMSPEFRADPYPFYAELRRSRPVAQVEPGGLLAVSRYDDVELVLKSPDRFAQGFKAAWQPEWLGDNPLASSMLALDGVPHARLRAAVGRAFGPSAIGRLEPKIRAVADELAADIASRGEREEGEVEALSAFAVPLTVFAIGELLGVDPALRRTLKEWTDDLVGVTPVRPSDAQAAKIRRTIAELRAFVSDLIDARRRAPADDLVSDLIHGGAGAAALSGEELVSMTALLLLGGFDTSTYLIANALMILADRPAEVAALRAEPAALPPFVEEALRFEPPVHGVPRVATSEAVIAGVVIPKGAPVLALLGSANRDEKRFEGADRFDSTRGRPGLSFGYGLHACIGAALARLEARLAIAALLGRFCAIERAPGGLAYNASLTVRGVVALPLRFVSG